MIEVFKTNITDPRDAYHILDVIRQSYPSYLVNFDLDDCDHILRIENQEEVFNPHIFVTLITASGYYAEILPDDDFTTLVNAPDVESLQFELA